MELSAAYTSSHQFSVDVTGLQYPSLEGGYGIWGRKDERGMMDDGDSALRRLEGLVTSLADHNGTTGLRAGGHSKGYS